MWASLSSMTFMLILKGFKSQQVMEQNNQALDSPLS